ncbi:unnamed protein product [Linum trigynum]|uniref:mitogen-activated protein kinase kinase kinase n=1 Tax=Linum trigynum TaxID=586398 RepID=A0AAV2FEI6_9ROSI
MATDYMNLGFEPSDRGDADDEGKEGESATRLSPPGTNVRHHQLRRRRGGCASVDFVNSSSCEGGLKDLPPPTLPNFDSLPVPPRHNSFHRCSVSSDFGNQIGGGGGGGNLFRHRGRSFTQKRLTRQRKLRHLGTDELPTMLTERRCSNSQPVSPDSSEKPPSPPGDGSGRYFPVPQPLPLPHRRFHRRLQSAGPNLGSGHNIGSPDKIPFSSFRGKVRHSSDQEIITLNRSRYSPPESPDFIAKARSSPGNSDRRSVSPLPQPLPRPDSFLSRRPESPVRTLSRRPDSPLRSPNGSGKSSSSRNDQNEIASRPASRSSSNCHEINLLPRSSSTSYFANLFPSRLATEPPLISISNRRKELPKDLNVCLSCKSGSVHSPQSTSSSCSSRAVSPHRSTAAGNCLPCPDEVHFHSDFEVPEFRPSGNISPSSLVKRAQSSPDVSPLPSPTLQKSFPCPRSPSKSPVPWHHTSEGSINQLNPCPLPLPPPSVAASPPQSYNPSPCRSPRAMLEKTPTPPRRNQWQKGKLIGRGTYGSVYVGTNRDTGALCAIKEVDIIPDDPKSAECVKQLEQEIKVLRHLKHPNIVQYLGSETVDDHFNIYLEYVYPGSISKYLQEHCEDITESIVRNFTRHILSGLAFLHGTKTIHRDIKGANLLVDASGIVKLADFGMAKHLAGISYQLSLKGTPHWMAPEVIQAVMQKDGSPDLAFAVDIWSLGCTVIEMFTGKPPWGDLQGPQAMFKVLNKSPPIPEALSAEGKDFLLSCFRRNPADRPTALALLEHPFVTGYSSDLNGKTSSPAPSFAMLMDKPQAPRKPAARRFDILPTLQGTRTMIETLSINKQVISNMPVSNHPLSILRSHGREVSYM